MEILHNETVIKKTHAGTSFATHWLCGVSRMGMGAAWGGGRSRIRVEAIWNFDLAGGRSRMGLGAS